MNKIFKKALCSFLVVVMCLTMAPLQGFVGLELPDLNLPDFEIGKLFSTTAKAATEGYYTYTVENSEATITDVDETISGDITIPSTLGGYPVTTIGEYAFSDCENLVSIEMPDSVTSIGLAAFFNCTSLASIEVSDNLTSIGAYAFYLCQNLIDIDLSNKTIVIEEYAFLWNSFTSLNINNSKITINSFAFAELYTLGSIVFYNCEVTIAYVGFLNCISLTSIDFIDCDVVLQDGKYIDHDTNNNEIVGYEAIFSDCDNIESVNFVNGSAIIGDGAFYLSSLKNVYFSSCKINSIGDYVFAGCESLASIEIPNSVTSIGKCAFTYCESLASIEIPDSVTSIGCCAFEGCSGLTSVIIPDSVTSIEIGVFAGCSSLESITIPDTVTSIEYSAFDDCNNLTDVYYAGSEAQWNSITIVEDGNEDLTNATIHYNSTDPALSITPTSKTLAVGETQQLKVTVPYSGKINVKWSSSNTNVATVSSTGKVTANSVGTATIVIKTTDGAYSTDCEITVVDKLIPVKEFNIPREEATITANDNYQIYYNIQPYNATNRKVIWQSSDTGIATVSNGIVSAKKAGIVTITAKTEDGQYEDRIKILIRDDTRSDSQIDKVVNDVILSFNSGWFFNDSIDYNHLISKLCSAFIVLGYKEDSVIERALNAIGFSNCEIKPSTGRDEVNYFIASREIKVNGECKLMVFTGYIGSFKRQWNSNFDPLAIESTSSNNHYSEKRGITHLGFDDARYSVYSNLISYIQNEQEKKGYSTDDTVVLVTGHSRGAATANLVGADLIRGATNESGFIKVANAKNIFTYTYATPNSTKADDVNASKFNRIFNIVNPEDFVTKVLPVDWKFSRYGQTYILPSRTNEKNYSYYYDIVNSYYKEVSEDDEYTNYATGELTVFNIVNRFVAEVKNISQYYLPTITSNGFSAFSYFQTVICPFVNKTTNDWEKNLALATALDLLASDPLQINIYSRITGFFVTNNKLNDKFEDAHVPETYYAFMHAMTESEVVEGTVSRRKSSLYQINCPVDITVIEKESGEIVAQITDNVVNEEIAAKDNSLVASVDGDSKGIWIPDIDAYEVILTGNDDGIMDYTISTIDSDKGEISRVNYFGVPVEDDVVMMADVTETANDVQFGSIYNEYGEELVEADILDTDELNQHNITISVNGFGIVSGDRTYTAGDYVTLMAQPDENNTFIGWYENGELISTDSEYSFVIKSSREFTAEFTDNFVEATGIEINSEKEIELICGVENNGILLKADIIPSNATEKSLSWESSDEDVVIVDEHGIVTVIGVGTSKIKAVTANGIAEDEITVNVICEHSFGSYVIGENPSCVEQGFEVAYCSVCSQEDVKLLNATGHKFNDSRICTECGMQENLSASCEHMCHKTGFMNFIWKIVQFFWKLFNMNPICECGAAHY